MLMEVSSRDPSFFTEAFLRLAERFNFLIRARTDRPQGEMTVIEYINTEDGAAAKFPYELKDAFRKAFPSAKWSTGQSRLTYFFAN